jgi:hypothetical protein
MSKKYLAPALFSLKKIHSISYDETSLQKMSGSTHTIQDDQIRLPAAAVNDCNLRIVPDSGLACIIMCFLNPMECHLIPTTL